MSVDLVQPARLLVGTSAGPLEVVAAASVAAAVASDVFSAAVREECSQPGRVDYAVTPPLTHHPVLRLQVSWVEVSDGSDSSWAVWVEVVDVEVVAAVAVIDAGAGADLRPLDRVRRADRAVERFVEVLTLELTR